MSRIPRPKRYRDNYGHLIIDGYTYMGGNRIPPLPQHIVMTDRTDGVLRSLSHTGTSPALTIDIVLPNSRWPDVATFGAYEGPYISGHRLYIDAGVLGAEPIDPPYPTNLRVLTRRNFDRTMLDITVDADGTIIYTEFSV